MPITINGTGPIDGITSLNTSVSSTELGFLDGVTSGIQTQINASGGLVKITDTAFSAQSTVSINNCFSSIYDNYLIKIDQTPSASNDIILRLRASGSDNSSANYQSIRFHIYTSTNNQFNVTNQTSYNVVGATDPSAPSHIAININNPFLSRLTTMYSDAVFRNTSSVWGRLIGMCEFSATTSFDGFSIYVGSGTITGNIRVYGYRN